jgi:hypothetical protein
MTLSQKNTVIAFVVVALVGVPPLAAPLMTRGPPRRRR